MIDVSSKNEKSINQFHFIKRKEALLFMKLFGSILRIIINA